MYCTLCRFGAKGLEDNLDPTEVFAAFAPAVVHCAIHTKCLDLLWQVSHTVCTDGTDTAIASSAFVQAIQASELQKPSKLPCLVEMGHQVVWPSSSQDAMHAMCLHKILALATEPQQLQSSDICSKQLKHCDMKAQVWDNVYPVKM